MNALNFQVRRSPIQGRGLFALTLIAPRMKIGELGGELISQREARKRARILRSIMIVEMEDGTAFDATRYGSGFRYVNHSCAPNIFMRRCRGRVEFYALREIRPGEELTCDYGETHHAGGLRCRCGSAGCRGRI